MLSSCIFSQNYCGLKHSEILLRQTRPNTTDHSLSRCYRTQIPVIHDYLNSHCLFEDHKLYFSYLYSCMPSAYLKLSKQNKIFSYDVFAVVLHLSNTELTISCSDWKSHVPINFNLVIIIKLLY